MATDLLTTSGINSLVNTYKTSESNKKITPLTTRRTRYQNLDSAYSTLNTKLTSLKSILSTLKTTGSSSAFTAKSASSSNTSFVTTAASNSALAGTHSIRINQLAKNDLLLSLDQASDDASTTITSAGTHTFTITSGDGSGGTFTSNVSVTFESADFTAGVISNKKVMEKIQTAINTDKAIVTSNSVTGSTASSGAFTFNLNGTETTINYSSGTYSDVIDSIVSQINDLSGVSAEKVIDGSNYQLKITVTDSSKYLTINGDTSNLVSELGIAVTKEKGSSGIVSASTFSPVTSTSQFSLTAKNSGYDYRILSLQDTGTSTALSAMGLNLGSTRQVYVQNSGLDTPGYVHSSSLLNAKLEFNGINVERNSNVITDLVSGVTFNLKSSMQTTDTTVNIAVDNDTAKVKEKIQSFITNFNDLYTFIKTKTTSTDTARGLLVGDASSSSILSILRSSATNVVSGIDTDDINSLSKLGITFNINNGLSITDSDQLDDALENNADQVEALFNSTYGIANVLYPRIDAYLGTEGYISKTRANFSKTIENLNDSISSSQTKINKSAEILRTQYQKMQAQLATLLSNQSYFMSNSYY